MAWDGSVRCSACGALVATGNSFCVNCGAAVLTAATAQAPPPVSAAPPPPPPLPPPAPEPAYASAPPVYAPARPARRSGLWTVPRLAVLALLCVAGVGLALGRDWLPRMPVGIGEQDLQALVGDWEFVEEGEPNVVMRFSLETDRRLRLAPEPPDEGDPTRAYLLLTPAGPRRWEGRVVITEWDAQRGKETEIESVLASAELSPDGQNLTLTDNETGEKRVARRVRR